MASEIFTLVPDIVVILESRGVYKQCQVYQLGQYLFAKLGGGFVRLMRNGTSNRLDVHAVIADGASYGYDKIGRMILTNSEGPTA